MPPTFFLFLSIKAIISGHNTIIPRFSYIKAPCIEGLTPVFETGIKTPFKQPIADNLSVIGCLVS
ncbi:hypothetical protein ACFQ75_23845, partial [Bacillus subtilis]